MDNSKCLFNHVSAHASVDFIDACETLHKELLKSMKIVKKFREELKLANLEIEELVVRLDTQTPSLYWKRSPHPYLHLDIQNPFSPYPFVKIPHCLSPFNIPPTKVQIFSLEYPSFNFEGMFFHFYVHL